MGVGAGVSLGSGVGVSVGSGVGVSDGGWVAVSVGCCVADAAETGVSVDVGAASWAQPLSSPKNSTRGVISLLKYTPL